VSVKIDAEVARMAKLVAEYENTSAAAYMSEILRPIVAKDLERHSRKFLDSRPGRPQKGSG